MAHPEQLIPPDRLQDQSTRPRTRPIATRSLPHFTPLPSPHSPHHSGFDPQISGHDISDEDPILIPSGSRMGISGSPDFEFISGFAFPDIPIDASILPDFPAHLRTQSPPASGEHDIRRRHYEPWSTPSGLSEQSNFEVLPSEENTLYPASDSEHLDSLVSSTSTVSSQAHPLFAHRFTVPSPVPPSNVSQAARINNGLELESTPPDLWDDDTDGGFVHASQSDMDHDSTATSPEDVDVEVEEPPHEPQSDDLGQSGMSWTAVLDHAVDFRALSGGSAYSNAQLNPEEHVGVSSHSGTGTRSAYADYSLDADSSNSVEPGSSKEEESDSPSGAAPFSRSQYRSLPATHTVNPQTRPGHLHYRLPWFDGMHQTLGSRFDVKTSNAYLSYRASNRLFRVKSDGNLRLLFMGSFLQWNRHYKSVAYSLMRAVHPKVLKKDCTVDTPESGPPTGDAHTIVECDFYPTKRRRDIKYEIRNVSLAWTENSTCADDATVVVKETWETWVLNNRFPPTPGCGRYDHYHIAVFPTAGSQPPRAQERRLTKELGKLKMPILRIAISSREKYDTTVSEHDLTIIIQVVDVTPKQIFHEHTAIVVDPLALASIPSANLNHHLEYLRTAQRDKSDVGYWPLITIPLYIARQILGFIEISLVLFFCTLIRSAGWLYSRGLDRVSLCVRTARRNSGKISSNGLRYYGVTLVPFFAAFLSAAVIILPLCVMPKTSLIHSVDYGYHARRVPFHHERRIQDECRDNSLATHLQMCKPGLELLEDSIFQHLLEHNLFTPLSGFVQQPASWDLNEKWSVQALTESSFALVRPRLDAGWEFVPPKIHVLAAEDPESGNSEVRSTLHFKPANFTLIPIHKTLSVVTVDSVHQSQKLLIKGSHATMSADIMMIDLRVENPLKGELSVNPCKRCLDLSLLLETIMHALTTATGQFSPTEMISRLSEAVKAGHNNMMSSDRLADWMQIVKSWKEQTMQSGPSTGVANWWPDASKWADQATQMATDAMSKASEMSHRALDNSWSESTGEKTQPAWKVKSPRNKNSKTTAKGRKGKKAPTLPKGRGILECKKGSCKPGPAIQRAGMNARRILNWVRE